MSSSRAFIYAVVLLCLIALNAAIGYAILVPRPHVLRVSFLDVGQGDSILIQSPTGETMLVDGGRDRSVLRQLSTEFSPLTRDIDMVVETHPDADHISGLIDVFERYQVGSFMSPGIADDTKTAERLETAATGEPGIERLTARRGMRIHLGEDVYADVLYPDKDVSHISATNDGSVVLHLVYGDTSFMLTGDLSSTMEDHLVAIDADDGELPSDVLKAGHHGSRYSTDDAWLAAVHPATVVISAGKDNTYGHPSPDTLARIQKEGAAILSTIDAGTIDFMSDGKTITEHGHR